MSDRKNVINPFHLNKNQKIRLIGWLVLLVFVILYVIMTDRERISVAIKDEILTCSFSSGETFDIKFEDVLSVAEIQNFEPGRFVSGSETTHFRVGVWENDQFGIYRLCSYRDVTRYVIVETQDDYFVINFESENATASFYEAFTTLLADN